MNPALAAAIRDWTARQVRTREEARLNPDTSRGATGPCLACGRTTRHLDGYCNEHRRTA